MSKPRILVPYATGVHAETVKAADASSGAVSYVDTSRPEGYWQTLAVWWMAGESFIVLEQDKVPEPGLLQKLWDCPEPWCTVKVPMRPKPLAAGLMAWYDTYSPYPSLACTKFDAQLMEAHPHLMDDVGQLDLGFGEKEWSRLDMGVAGLLSLWWTAHYHDGVVEHLHEEVVAV